MAHLYIADSSRWEAAFELYYDDLVLEAHKEIDSVGIGEEAELLKWYRVIEAEAITREKSVQRVIAPWLTLEYVPDETMGLEDTLAERVLHSCEEVAQRLGWSHDVLTLVSIFAEETDAPWATNPYGYCVSKNDLEKICLPSYLIDDPAEFCQAVAHEYAHVISNVLAQDYAARWVEEAISVLVERRFNRATWHTFIANPETWLRPRTLEDVLVDRNGGVEESERIWRAYQQAGWLGRYMATLQGERGLGELLAKIADESVINNLRRSASGLDRTEWAIQVQLGIDVDTLFLHCYEWLKIQDPNDLSPE